MLFVVNELYFLSKFSFYVTRLAIFATPLTHPNNNSHSYEQELHPVSPDSPSNVLLRMVDRSSMSLVCKYVPAAVIIMILSILYNIEHF